MDWMGEMSESAGQPAEDVVQPNSYVLIDYTLTVKETGELVDTTAEEEAKKANAYDASKIYEPRLVVVGRGMLLKAVEDALVGMKPGEKKTFDIPPEQAFGPRDPSKVKTIPLRKLKDVEGPVRVGDVISIEGRQGVIRSIGSGRVQVDFNHYLSGKTLVCTVEVKSIINDGLERARRLIHGRLPDIPVDKLEVVAQPPELRVRLPEEAFLAPGLQVAKRALAKELKEAVSGVEKVVFVEEYT